MRSEYSTKQRSAILDFLKENSTHASVSDILYHLKEKNIKISVATIYRALERFESEGIIRKMVVGQGTGACYQYIESSSCMEHFHLKCIRCGRLIHLSCEFLEDMQNHIQREHSFSISSGRTVIYGTCNNCLGEKIDTPPCKNCHSHK